MLCIVQEQSTQYWTAVTLAELVLPTADLLVLFARVSKDIIIVWNLIISLLKLLVSSSQIIKHLAIIEIHAALILVDSWVS